MQVEVCTVWAPRPNHPQWRDDYLSLIGLQAKTARCFGHKHSIVTDAVPLPGSEFVEARLPESLMPAMIAGVVERLKRPSQGPIVFVDVDCIVNRDLREAFKEEFDLGLTRRASDLSPINNGAMYVANPSASLPLFEYALSICKDHWGADQEAISEAASPVPEESGTTGIRHGANVLFISMKTHNSVPKAARKRSFARPFIVHFKGETKKWANEYVNAFL